MPTDTYIGFDSAWTNNPKKPGSICAVCIEDGREAQFYAPRRATFAEAIEFIRTIAMDGVTLVALDQPTIVLNNSGMRPVERAAAQVVSWLGGGVQPSNTRRLGMFCEASPIWPFIKDLQAIEDPELAREATTGRYLIEVFPALALASMDQAFFGRLAAPRYNPIRKKTFRASDWTKVADVASEAAWALGCPSLSAWCSEAGKNLNPAKGDQDELDAALCALVALRWRLRSRIESLLLGDLRSGYMVLPISECVRERLAVAARKCSVLMDGKDS